MTEWDTEELVTADSPSLTLRCGFMAPEIGSEITSL